MKLTTKEAARYLGISHYYLRNLRHGMHGDDGPIYTVEKHPRGQACYYLQTELDRWASAHAWKEGTRPPAIA